MPSSYTQILKSSSLIGGAQGINLLLGMVRVKFAAVLIGPVGVGLIGNYTAIQGLVGTVAGLGIQSSGVRDVAAAVGQGDPEAIGRTVITLRRVCWLTGLLGALAMMALAALLARGWIEVRNCTRSNQKRGYHYRLTPDGLGQKARLADRLLQRKRAEHQALLADIEQLRAEVQAAPPGAFELGLPQES